MLDMFKRPTDPPEFNYLYSAAGAVMVAALYAAHKAGIPHIY